MKWTLIGTAAVALVATASLVSCGGDTRDADGDGIVTRDEAAESYAQDLATAQGLVDHYRAASNDLAAEVQDLRDQLAELGDDPTAAVVAEGLDGALEAKANADKIADGAADVIARINAKIAEIPPEGLAVDVDSTVFGEILAGVATVLPPPWNLILGSGAVAVPLVWRKLAHLTQERDGAIATVNHIKRSSPEVAKFVDENGEVIKGVQGGPAVAKRINKARKDL
jgi:hypothetical protein